MGVGSGGTAGWNKRCGPISVAMLSVRTTDRVGVGSGGTAGWNKQCGPISVAMLSVRTERVASGTCVAKGGGTAGWNMQGSPGMLAVLPFLALSGTSNRVIGLGLPFLAVSGTSNRVIGLGFKYLEESFKNKGEERNHDGFDAAVAVAAGFRLCLVIS